MEFQTGYTSAMDRGYYAPPSVYGGQPEQKAPDIEEPLIPIDELGETVVERDPRTGANILQNVTAAVRAGASKIQLVMSTGPEQAIGGRPKAYGEEVREAIRELTKANEVKITGVELPTSISNLSGYSQQTGMISDETRHMALNEVRDAVKFVADVAGGGGIDIFSVEYPRTIFDAGWNKEVGTDAEGNPIYQFEAYPEEHERAVKHIVDDRTGRVLQDIRMNQEMNYPVWKRYQEGSKEWEDHGGREYRDKHGNTVKPGDYIGWDGEWVERVNRIPQFDEKNKNFKVEKKTWEYFKSEADEINEEKRKKFGKELDKSQIITPQEAFLWASTESQERIAKGYEAYYGRQIDVLIERRRRLEKALEFYKEIDESLPDKEKYKIFKENLEYHDEFGIMPPVFQKIPEILETQLFRIKRDIQQSTDTMVGQRQTAEDLRIQRDHITTAEKYAMKKSFESYAEAGLFAMDETHSNPNVKNPLYVGPEIGWPQGYGAHPQEFIDLIKESRKVMAEKLMKERKFNHDEAERAAHEHIKGLFDTSHMGMWLNNFRRIPGESDQKRLDEFNKWYMDWVQKMADEDVIGQVQAVDSASGAHGHLPPGQGIFPVVDAVKLLKKKNPDLHVVSEGHEEEQFGQNRILLETWKAFGGATFGTGGASSMPRNWANVQNQYFGRTYPPYFIYGGYAPSNEWTLWTQVPFE